MNNLTAVTLLDDNGIRTVYGESDVLLGIITGPTSATDGHVAVFNGPTGKLLKDGGAPGGGGSFLSANTARVDPSGFDTGPNAGVVGDLSKPFLTVQAAVTAIDNSVAGFGTIQLNGDYSSENVTTTAATYLEFVGFASGSSITAKAFSSITDTGHLAGVTTRNINLGTITASTTGMFVVDCRGGGVPLSDITVANGALIVFGPGNTMEDLNTIGGTWTAANQVLVSGFPSMWDDISLVGNYVDVEDSVINGSITATTTVTFYDGRCKGGPIVAPGGIYYSDVFLSPTQYDFVYDFSVLGGAVGAIPVTTLNLPANLVITGATLEIVTPLDSASHLALAELGITEGDFQAATIVSGAPWSSTGFKAITFLGKVVSPENVILTISVEDLTAGKFTLHVEGYLSP